jgi:hypothetical protein
MSATSLLLYVIEEAGWVRNWQGNSKEFLLLSATSGLFVD